MATVYQEFFRTSQNAAEKPFLHIPASAAKHYASSAIDLSYAEGLTAIDACAQDYQRKGYGCPMRVGLLLENRAAFFIHWLALNKLGCSVVPINGEMQPEEINYFLDHSEAAVVVSVPEKLPLLEDACQKLRVKPALIDFNKIQDLPAVNQQGSRESPTIDKNTECALLYTSGSTGKPKGCILNNTYFTAFGAWYRNFGGLGEIEWGKERLLTPLPLGHMNAMAVSTTGMIMNAGCIVQLDRFHPKTWWQSVRESKATMLHYLGVLPAILLELPDNEDDDFSQQIKFGFGAGVNPKHHAIFEKRFGFPLIESWAMTECGSGGCISANHEPRHVGSCCFGSADASVEYQLVDEKKNVVAKGEPGELRVRAAGRDPKRGFFSGYLKNPEATAEAWQDGWLNTGDVIREGDDGKMHFVDRRKNVIRRSGENISALDVESAMSQDPAISEILVCPVPDDLRGDEVAACIITKDSLAHDQQLADDIVRRGLEHLAYYKLPGYIIFCDDLPKTASNKPRRADVKNLAKNRVESQQCYDTRRLKKRVK